MKRPTARRVRQLFSYDPKSGRLERYSRPGQKAGYFRKGSSGVYLIVRVDDQQYSGASIIWLYMTGHWPRHTVDHKNRNTLDNSWKNLRDATRSQQMINRVLPNKFAPGVSQIYSRGVLRPRWKALLRVNKSYKYLGCFKSPKEAASAYAKAKRPYELV